MAVRRERGRSALAKLKRARYGRCRVEHALMSDRDPKPWQDQLFETLKGADIRQVGYVPDAGHSRLIARCKADPDIRDVVLTTEEEAVAMAAGAWLGGQPPSVLMQSSGVGNCVNMLSLIRACRFPVLMLGRNAGG